MNRSRLLVALLCTMTLLLTSCGLLPGSAAPTAAPAPTAVPAPSAAPAEEPAPTAIPTDAPAPTPPPLPMPSPEDTVRGFLGSFVGVAGAADPALFLTDNLRSQIRPDYPLNYLMGMQNLFSGFEIQSSDGGPERVNVHATLTFGQPLPYTFELVQEDGRWAIDRVVVPPSTAMPTPQPGSDTGSGIYYIAPGGETIMRVQPDGSGAQEAFTGLTHIMGGPLTYLGAIPAHPMQVVIAGAGTHYEAISGGVSIDMGAFAAPPRWSADGWRAVGASPSESGPAGTIAIFDLNSGQRSDLPISGQPDWFPDGQRLVYVRCGPEDMEKGCNVWTYDLASGASAQISTLVSTVDDRWYVQEAHVLPDGNTVIFYGNHTTEVGASGNGLQWWAIPASGGDAQLFSESYGNGVNDFQFSPDGAQMAYITRAHVSACASSGDLLVRDSSPAGDPARGVHPTLPGIDESNDHYAIAQGLSWDPAGSAQLVFGSQSYHCTDMNREMDPAAIYLWDSAAPDAAPRMLTEGSFPVWIP